MAEYKKKSIKPVKHKIKNAVTQEIPMSSKPMKPKKPKSDNIQKIKQPSKPANDDSIKIIKGNKYAKRKKRLIWISVFALAVVTVIVLNSAMPTGIFEFVQNSFAKIGSGSGYPVTLGGGSIADTQSGGNYFLISSATNFEGYNANGKNIFTYQHGYETPVIKKSQSRFMLYSQGDTEYSIYNLKKNVVSAKTTNSILAAALADNGYYAVATQSDSYASQVTVYNSKNEVVYKWFCSDYMITDIVLSPDGKTMAAAVFNSNNGVYFSKIYILKYSSANPVKLFEYNDRLIFSLRSYNKYGFFAIFNNDAEYISWKSLEHSNFEYEKNIIFARGDTSNSVLVTCREANSADNTVYSFDKKGKNIYQFSFENEISDIAVSKKYIYILSDRKIYLYNLKGELLNSADCAFGIERIIPVGNFRVAAITDNKIQKILFK